MNNQVFHIQWGNIWLSMVGLVVVTGLIIYLIAKYNKFK